MHFYEAAGGLPHHRKADGGASETVAGAGQPEVAVRASSRAGPLPQGIVDAWEVVAAG